MIITQIHLLMKEVERMGINIYNTIDFLKVEEIDWEKAFNYIEEYIIRKKLAKLSFEDKDNKEIIFLKATEAESYEETEGCYKKIEIYGDLVTGKYCEGFEIYNKVSRYLTKEMYEIYSKLKGKSLEDKYKYIQGLGYDKDYLTITIWDSKTQGLKYHWDLVAIILIMKCFLSDAVMIDGCILKSQIEAAEKEVREIIGINNLKTLFNIEQLDNNYRTTATLLTILGGYKISYDYSINTTLISEPEELWRYEYGQKFNELISGLIEGFHDGYLKNIKQVVGVGDRQALIDSIVKISEVGKLVWEKSTFNFVINNRNICFLRNVEAMLVMLLENVYVRGSQIQRDDFTTAGYEIEMFFKEFLKHTSLIKLLEEEGR